MKRRMDVSDATFADRVNAVIRGDPCPSGTPVFSAAQQSNIVREMSGGGGRNDGNPMSYAACAGLPPKPTRMSKEDVYWQCRRSLRIWPVPEGDVKRGLRTYLKDRLRLSTSFLADMGEISVKRIAAGPRSKIVGEVVAIFSSVDVRDAVKGAARELAACPDAGMRLEIPQYLQPSLKALETVSYNLKQKHAGIRLSLIHI